MASRTRIEIQNLTSRSVSPAQAGKIDSRNRSSTYDALYELTQATQGNTTTESYSYDPAGNRTASLGVSSYTTNSSNEMTANSNASYTYDSNGNTLTETDSTGATSYAWDYENRMTSVTLPNSGGTVSFKMIRSEGASRKSLRLRPASSPMTGTSWLKR